jgi:hypothetical protein
MPRPGQQCRLHGHPQGPPVAAGLPTFPITGSAKRPVGHAREGHLQIPPLVAERRSWATMSTPGSHAAAASAPRSQLNGARETQDAEP